MRFAPHQPFRVRLWVGHVGGSFTVQSELYVTAQGEGGGPAVVAESSVVLWDTVTNRPWPIDEAVRETLNSYRGPVVSLRPRPN